MTINSSTITGNQSADGGGGLTAEGGKLYVRDSAIVGNVARDLRNGGGGMRLYLVYPSSISNCTISGNSASYGGGMQIAGGPTSITDCTISGNSARYAGGGLALDAYAEPTIGGCTISGNTAARGAGIALGGIGIHAPNGFYYIRNCTIAGNSASVAGGGILYNCGYDGANVIITNSTIAGNRGSGIVNQSSNPGAPAQMDLFYTIVAGNTSSDGTTPLDLTGNLLGEAITGDGWITYSSSNLIGTDTTGTQWNDGVYGVQNLLNVVDPGLAPLAGNGGPTQTMALLPGSPAIDVAYYDPNLYYDDGQNPYVPPVTDQRGFQRVANGLTDIGAYERQTYLSPPAQQLFDVGVAQSFAVGDLFIPPGTAPGSWPLTVDWGDGSPATTFTVSAGGPLPAQPHTYQVPGSYTVTVASQTPGLLNSTTFTAAQKPPAIASADHTTFTAGSAGSFTVTTSALPATAFQATGPLPGGLTFNTRTGVLSGTTTVPLPEMLAALAA